MLTDHRLFAPVYLCDHCGKTLAAHESGELHCSSEAFTERDDKRFIAPPFDVVVERVPTGEQNMRGEPVLELRINVEHAMVVHSPTGFEVGYGGSGPAELALNILCACIPPREAWRLHQSFKWHFLSRLDQFAPRQVIAAADIKDWIEREWQTLAWRAGS